MCSTLLLHCLMLESFTCDEEKGYCRFQLTFQCNIPKLVGNSQVRCEVQKFISEFGSQFVNKDCDWPFNSMKPIKFLIHKPACKFRNELLNFATNLRTSQRTSECCSEKLAEIDNKS